MYGYGCGWWGPFGWTGMIASLVIGLVLIAGLVWLAVWAMRRVSSTSVPAASPGSQTPLELLQGRYARGEITREQFLNMKEDLKQ